MAAGVLAYGPDYLFWSLDGVLSRSLDHETRRCMMGRRHRFMFVLVDSRFISDGRRRVGSLRNAVRLDRSQL